MSQLRPGSDIGEGSKLGNFVEIKQSKVAANSSISHLSYVGDAEIGEDVNIGCGFITCNYDGAKKHKTVIGDGSFIGSDCQVIAPINIGKESYVGSGSTLNKDVPDGAFAIARSRQETKEGMARKFIKKKS
jgi:bifunctional UDP-N-acetylglucosamine pyrophosphorylase/glucosamine-1-phosphate N-acetyltransferase